ncbi:MAG: hypothetical protein P8X83_08265 [Nitrosopumilaceae archaeon]
MSTMMLSQPDHAKKLLQTAQELGLLYSTTTTKCPGCKALFPREYGKCPHCKSNEFFQTIRIDFEF